MMSSFGTIQVILYLSLLAKEDLPEACNFKPSSFASRKPGRLNGHLLRTYAATRSVVDCVALCSRDTRCASANYFLDGQHCELNNQTASNQTAHEQFVLDKSTVYFEIQTKWDEWSAWSLCSSPCSNGTQTRSRTCCGRVADPSCAGSETETKHCFLQKCDPKWLNWSAWDSCVNCRRTRSRVCENPDNHGACVGDATQVEECNVATSCSYTACGSSGNIDKYAALIGVNSYGNSQTCTWTIRVAVGKFIEWTFQDLKTEQCCDRVNVIDSTSGTRSFSGLIIPTDRVVSSTNELTVQFQSDGSVATASHTHYNGFRLKYTTVE